MSISVQDVMTSNVIAVATSTSFKDMAGMLGIHRQDMFPVLDDDGTVIGVVSEADLLAKQAVDGRIPRPAARAPGRKQAKAAGLTAADLMTQPPVTVSPATPVADAARLMYARKINQLPVVDAAGHLAGFVGRDMLLSAYARPDEEIRRQVTGSLQRDGLLSGPGRFTVTVTDGIVTLHGHPDSIPAGHRIVAEIGHLDGVVAVRDQLTYPSTVHQPKIAPQARSA